MRSLSALPILNFILGAGVLVIVSPVLGLRHSLAFCSCTSKLPNPLISIRWRSVSAAARQSTMQAVACCSVVMSMWLSR